jgi:chaperonin cofactor prefoldin
MGKMMDNRILAPQENSIKEKIMLYLTQQGLSIDEASAEIEGLEDRYLRFMLKYQLRRKDMNFINDFHMRAVHSFRIPPKLFLDKQWFNSEAHFLALAGVKKLISDTETALNCLQALTQDQLIAVKCGHAYTDVTVLTPVQVQAINQLSQTSELTCQHLKDQEWFDDEKYIDILRMLLKKMSPDQAINTLKLAVDQLKLNSSISLQEQCEAILKEVNQSKSAAIINGQPNVSQSWFAYFPSWNSIKQMMGINLQEPLSEDKSNYNLN